jgi:DNA replication protein DnaC
MLQQPMKEKLHALKLQGMVEALEYQEQDEATRELNFLDRLALLVDQQWNWRQNQALTRRVMAARLRGSACVEDIDYRAERGLNRSVIRALAQESAWVANHEHIFVLGPTGVGKSYVASALAQKACRDGYRVYYTRAAALFRDLSLARADGSLRQLSTRPTCHQLNSRFIEVCSLNVISFCAVAGRHGVESQRTEIALVCHAEGAGFSRELYSSPSLPQHIYHHTAL